jgi:hypothetical protein
MNNLIRMTKFGLKNRLNRIFTSKATYYSESYSTAFPTYTVHSNQYNNNKKNEITHTGGFKRDHEDQETKKPCSDEKWFSTQLSSYEDYKTMKIGNEGNGSKLFPYKYGNSFWDPHNYN